MKTLKFVCILLSVLVVLLSAGFVWLLLQSNQHIAQLEKNAQELSASAQTLQQNAQALSSDAQALSSNAQTLSSNAQTLEQNAQELAQNAAEALNAAQTDLSEYKLYKNIISQDEVEKTLFGQPISEERNGEYRIGVKTAIDGDFHAELTIYQAQDKEYVEVFSCPAVIGKNGPGKQSEGDVKTPLGTWTIGEAYGINDDPGAQVPYTKITDDMYWCATGSNGKNYNTLIYRSDDPDADYSEDEHLIDYPGVYNYLLYLGYNAPGAPYAGNAIFLHCWRGPDSPTGGCVAVSEEDMIKILQTVTPGTAVTIY